MKLRIGNFLVNLLKIGFGDPSAKPDHILSNPRRLTTIFSLLLPILAWRTTSAGGRVVTQSCSLALATETPGPVFTISWGKTKLREGLNNKKTYFYPQPEGGVRRCG